MDKMTLIQRIDQRLEHLGLSDRKASEMATGSIHTIRTIRRGSIPSIDRLSQLATVLGVTVDWLLNGDGTNAVIPANVVKLSPNSPPNLPPRHEMPADVPVYGTAAGSLGEGSFQMASGEIIDRVRRPPGIANATDIYALYVEGDSMEPRYQPGELMYVSEKRPVRPGDYVIVQIQNGEHDGAQAYVKRLTRRTADKLILEQSNPKATLEIPMSKVKAVHRILTMNELVGV